MDKKIHIWLEEDLKIKMKNWSKENETTISQETRKMWKEKIKNDSNMPILSKKKIAKGGIK